MIHEALTWLTTPAPDWARKLGYLRELIAIDARYRRCRAAWEPHLKASHDTIRKAIARCERRRQAVVYGSGLLLDIPIDDLSNAFRNVTLVDAAHLRKTRRTLRRFDNVGCVEADVSGVALGLLLGAGKGADRLPQPAAPPMDASSSIDLVVSANLLAQLPIIPLRFLDRRLGLPGDAQHDYARAIMRAHLDHLAGFGAVRCLITETRSERVSDDGTVLESSDVLRGLELPMAERSWDWTVAPVGEVSRGFAIRNHVAAAIILPQCSEGAANRHGRRLDTPLRRA